MIGNQVTNNIDHLVINTFTWSGPQDVPNYAIYSYTATGGDSTNSGWVAPAVGGALRGTPAQTMTGQNSDTADPNKQSLANIFWNSSTPVVAGACYRASSNYVWGYDVNEVAVNIVNSPNNGVAAVNVPRRPAAGYMSASLLISIVGPRVNGAQRGVRFIQAGFIQQCNLVTQSATYTNAAGGQITAGQLVNLGPNGRNAWLQGQTVLDIVTSPLSTVPWYVSTITTALFDGRRSKPSARGALFQLATTDVPFARFQNNNIIIRQGGVPTSYACTAITSNWAYTLQFAVRTTETAGNGSGVYTRRAAARWDYSGNGLLNNLVRNFSTPGGGTFCAVVDGTPVPITTGAGPNRDEVMNDLLTAIWSF